MPMIIFAYVLVWGPNLEDHGTEGLLKGLLKGIYKGFVGFL